MTLNIVGQSTMPSKSKGEQLAVNFEESDVERSPGLKNVLIEPEGIYQYTRICTGMIAAVDYNCWQGGSR